MKRIARLLSATVFWTLFFVSCVYAQNVKQPVEQRNYLLEWIADTIGCAIGRQMGLEEFVYKQFGPSLVHLPSSLLAYPLKPQTTAEVRIARQKAGGFMRGICHGSSSNEQLKNAGIEWDRLDIPFPFDKSGNLREGYINFKKELQQHAEIGMKIMAVTPYPRTFIEFGIDPRRRENEARVKEIAVFLLQDLQGLVGALQITNEMGLPRFTNPLTMKEAVRFIGIQLEAIHPLRGDVLIGYNSAGPQVDLHLLMKPYHQFCDYVGIDIYIGCFTSFGNYLWMYDVMLAYMWSFTRKPVILCEFGYIGGGAPKTPEEKRAILERYGVSSEAEARKNIQEFVSRLPQRMQDRIRNDASGDWGNFVFNTDFKDHLYTELPADVAIPAYPHTPEGQGDFYRDLLPRLIRTPYLLGAFIYKSRDTLRCYVCGQSECPIETRWGLLTVEGEPKPAFDAVRRVYVEEE